MRRPAWLLCAMFAVALFVTGCGRVAPLNVEKDIEIEGLSDHSISVSAPPKEQKVSVLVRTNAVPLDVYVVLEKDLASLKSQIADQKALTTSTLAKKEKVQESTLDATVPAGAGFAVVLVNPGNKKASASVKIASSK